VHTLLYSTAAAGLYAMTSAENAQGEQAIYLAGKILKLLFNHLSLSLSGIIKRWIIYKTTLVPIRGCKPFSFVLYIFRCVQGQDRN
jgi:hypothetical protein